jgi:hypothetical protein
VNPVLLRAGSSKLFLACVGVFAFVVGVALMESRDRKVERGYRYFGTQAPEQGGAYSIVVDPYFVGDRKRPDAELAALEIGGAAVSGAAARGPAGFLSVALSVPPATGAEIDITMGGPAGHKRARFTPLDAARAGESSVAYPAAVEWGAPVPPPLRVAVLPVGGYAVEGTPLHVLVRATTLSGDPLVGARIELAAPGLARGPATATDSRGLLRTSVSRPNGVGSFDVFAQLPSGELVRGTVALQPIFSQVRLEPPVLLATERTSDLAFSVFGFEQAGVVYCQAFADGSLRWAQAVQLEEGSARVTLPATALPADRVQCATHPVVPGNAGAAVPVWSASEPLGERLQTLAHGADGESAWVAKVSTTGALAAGAPENGALLWWAASLRSTGPSSITLLHDTALLEQAALDAESTATRNWLLAVLGLGFLAMTVWMVFAIRSNYRDLERQFAQLQAEQGALGEPSAVDSSSDELAALGTLARRKATWQVAALFVIVILNGVGILLLLRLTAG